jgi:hypothetical protein
MNIEEANRRVVQSEHLVAGWRELIRRMQSDGRDVTVALDMLKNFENELKACRSSRDQAQRMTTQERLRGVPVV